jgi:hypothetical protein
MDKEQTENCEKIHNISRKLKKKYELILHFTDQVG